MGLSVDGALERMNGGDRGNNQRKLSIARQQVRDAKQNLRTDEDFLMTPIGRGRVQDARRKNWPFVAKREIGTTWHHVFINPNTYCSERFESNNE